MKDKEIEVGTILYRANIYRNPEDPKVTAVTVRIVNARNFYLSYKDVAYNKKTLSYSSGDNCTLYRTPQEAEQHVDLVALREALYKHLRSTFNPLHNLSYEKLQAIADTLNIQKQ